MIRPRFGTVRAAMRWAAAGLALAALVGCGPTRTACLQKAEAVLPASLRHDDSGVRALALEVYRDLSRPVPQAELDVIAAKDLGPARFAALLAKADEAHRNEILLSLLGLICGHGEPPACDTARADELLSQALESPQPALRAVALGIYDELDRGQGRPQFRPVASYPGAAERLASMLRRAKESHWAHGEYFETAFREVKDGSLRLAAIGGLARLGDHRYMGMVGDGLTDASPAVRRNAALILGLLGNRSAAPMLREHLADRDPVMRLAVGEAMSRLGDRSGLRVVRAVAEQESAETWVRVNAVLLLGRIGVPSEDIARLREFEVRGGRVEGALRLAAFGARARLGDYTRVGTLIDVAAGKGGFNAEQRSFALQLLARAAYGPAWREVCAAMGDGDATVRLSAAWAMLSFSTPRAEKVIEDVTSLARPPMLTEEEILRRSRQEWPVGQPGGPLDPGQNRRN